MIWWNKPRCPLLFSLEPISPFGRVKPTDQHATFIARCTVCPSVCLSLCVGERERMVGDPHAPPNCFFPLFLYPPCDFEGDFFSLFFTERRRLLAPEQQRQQQQQRRNGTFPPVHVKRVRAGPELLVLGGFASSLAIYLGGRGVNCCCFFKNHHHPHHQAESIL